MRYVWPRGKYERLKVQLSGKIFAYDVQGHDANFRNKYTNTSAMATFIAIRT